MHLGMQVGYFSFHSEVQYKFHYLENSWLKINRELSDIVAIEIACIKLNAYRLATFKEND